MNILFHLAGIAAIFLLGLAVGVVAAQPDPLDCGDYLAEGD